MTKKADARAFGQDIIKGESGVRMGDHKGLAAGRKMPQKVKGLLFTGDSGNDPAYYQKKRDAEARIGRKLSTAEFQRDFYEGPTVHAPGTSIFDPVLCELVYSWFSPPAGVVLDPFAGGSVRGVVAALLGRIYVGIDLSERQIAANRDQWLEISVKASVPRPVGLPSFDDDRLPDQTPIEARGDYWFKRDDAFVIGGGRGGKVRTCWALAQGAKGLVTAGSRASPQVNIVAQIARKLGIPCRVHTPEGELSPEVQMAEQAGAEVVQHKAGYNNVIIARAREDAEASGFTEIPFGMECDEAVKQTAGQVGPLPAGVKRIVVPVGSGMSLAGILAGLEREGITVPVVGVRVGADPTKRLDKYAPGWQDRVTLVQSALDYHDPAPETTLAGVALDPIYEAKCIPFMQPGDLLWIVGLRATEAKPAGVPIAPQWIVGDSADVLKLTPGIAPDLVFSCPPYVNLERYSDDPRDLSTMGYEEFITKYRRIVRDCCDRLKDDSFAVFVVGEVRDRAGNYYNFVGDTIKAFVDAGLHYYNEGILITPAGSLPVRASNQFQGSRKLGKTHQNLLVFVKGDGKRAALRCGMVPVRDMEAAIAAAQEAEPPDGLDITSDISPE